MTVGKLGTGARLICGILTLFISFGAVIAQDLMGKKSFEGILTVQVQNFERIQFFTYSVRYETIRVETAEREDNDAIVLIDYTAKKTFVILPGREQYVEIPHATEKSDNQRSAQEADVQKTDETEEIQGYTCDKLLAKSGGAEFQVWATKDLGTAGTFMTAFSPRALEPTPWQAEILSMGYFPLKVVELDSTGDERSRMEISAVQKRMMNESLFRVPAGYEKVDREALQPKPAPKKRRTR